MALHLVDAHCYLPIKYFTKEWEINLMKWEQTGLSAIIGVSTTVKECERILNLAHDSSIIIPAVGLHPWKIKKPIDRYNVYSYFDQLISEHPEIQIIGEVGLDFYNIRQRERYPFQRDTFSLFCSLSKQHNLQMIIHSPGAEMEILLGLKQYGIPGDRCVFHWFSGDPDELQKIIDYGCFFSITLAVAYSERHQYAAVNAPKNKILTESDGDVKYRTGIRGSPLIIPHIVELLARLWQWNLESVQNQVWENFLSFYTK
ncbi:MAG: TatD family hydrolase [Promethearchaeota archaeon]